jgi:ankyrin repeat protein
MVRMLLEQGADVDAQGGRHGTCKVDVDAKDGDGRTPLCWAAHNGHEAIVRLLVATSKVDVNVKDADGRTPLSWAAENGRASVVKLLLTVEGVNVNSKDNNGRTVILGGRPDSSASSPQLCFPR